MNLRFHAVPTNPGSVALTTISIPAPLAATAPAASLAVGGHHGHHHHHRHH
jgi:hypothetical protein